MSEAEPLRITPTIGDERYRIVLGRGIPVDPQVCDEALSAFIGDAEGFYLDERTQDEVNNKGAIKRAVQDKATYYEDSPVFNKEGYELGMLLMQRSIREQGQKQFGKIFKISPNAPRELRYVTMIIARHPSNNPEALFSIQQGEFIKKFEPSLREGAGFNIPVANSVWRGAWDYNYMVNFTVREEHEDPSKKE